MDRRQFLKACGLGGLWLAARGIGVASAAPPAAGKGGHPAPVRRPRPPGTCGGYADANADGVCDRSVSGNKPCKAIRCPGNAGYQARLDFAAKGAPAGVCGLWKDPAAKGFCAVCLEPKPCLYTICPAHREHAASGNKGKPA